MDAIMTTIRKFKPGDRVRCTNMSVSASKGGRHFSLSGLKGVVGAYEGNLVRFQPDDEAKRCMHQLGWGCFESSLELIETTTYEVSWRRS